MSVSRTTLSTSRPVSGVPFLAAAGVLWGTGGLFGSMLATATGLSSIAVAAYRLGVGGGLLCVFLLLTGRFVLRGRAAVLRVAATGALAALFQASYFAAVTMTSVSIATLVTIGSSPVLVLLARPRAATWRSLVSVALALVGLALLVGLGDDGAGNVVAGSVFAVIAASGFVAMTLMAGRPVAGLDAPTTTGAAFAFGGLLLAVLAGPAGLGFTPSAATIGLLAAFGLVPTALAYTAYFRGLQTAPASVGALLALLEPLTAAVLAAVLLGDRLGVVGVIGGVVLGVAVVIGANQRARSS